MEREKGNFFDLKLFSKLMVFVKPYNKIYYFVLTSAILLAGFSSLTVPFKISTCFFRVPMFNKNLVVVIPTHLKSEIKIRNFTFLSPLGNTVLKSSISINLYSSVMATFYSSSSSSGFSTLGSGLVYSTCKSASSNEKFLKFR